MSRTLGPSTIQTFSANAGRSVKDLPLSEYQTFNDWRFAKRGPIEALLISIWPGGFCSPAD
jgi:hypothetical protein